MPLQEKLFSINRNDRLIDATEMVHVKGALTIIESLQDKGAMYETWKLDIFIDENAVCLIIEPIPISAWYKKGLYEYSISLKKDNGTTGLSILGLARFLTKEEALKHVPYVQTFIQYRYDKSLLLDEKYDKNTNFWE